MKIYKFSITGTYGLLMHNPAAMAGPSGGLGTKKIPSAAEEAEAGIYRTEDGFMWFPAEGFKGAIYEAAKGRKIGKRYATAVVSGAVFCAEQRCLLYHPKTKKQIKSSEYKIDTRRAVVKGNGILRSRPVVDPWGCDVPLEIDEELVGPELVLDLLNMSGRMCGVGDFRPECKGPFGRFTATLEK